MNEREAHDAILKWARSEPRGWGLPCMRSHDGTCVVVDNSKMSSPRLAVGANWIEVLAVLRTKGGEL